MMLEGPPESLKRRTRSRGWTGSRTSCGKLPFVRKVTSVADYVKRSQRELKTAEPKPNVIPPDDGDIAQELFVFSLAGEGRPELDRVVASDYSRAQITIKLRR